MSDASYYYRASRRLGTLVAMLHSKVIFLMNYLCDIWQCDSRGLWLICLYLACVCSYCRCELGTQNIGGDRNLDKQGDYVKPQQTYDDTYGSLDDVHHYHQHPARPPHPPQGPTTSTTSSSTINTRVHDRHDVYYRDGPLTY